MTNTSQQIRHAMYMIQFNCSIWKSRRFFKCLVKIYSCYSFPLIRSLIINFTEIWGYLSCLLNETMFAAYWVLSSILNSLKEYFTIHYIFFLHHTIYKAFYKIILLFTPINTEKYPNFLQFIGNLFRHYKKINHLPSHKIN